MQRHDGSEYLPALFPTAPPTAKQSRALMRLMQEGTAWNLVVIIAQVVLVAEIVRTFPAEARMICRMIRRKKPNMAEILFLTIKYFALIGVVFDILVADTLAATKDEQCRAWAWTASTMYFLCSVLVFCVLAWRSQIIFRTCRRARWLLLGGLVGQFALTMFANYRVDKPNAMSPAGTCVPRRTLEHHHRISGGDADPEDGAERVWDSATFWWLLYSTLFDLAMLVSTSVRLIRTSSGPQGLTKIAKVLVVNNLHYLLGVETCNLVEIIMLIGWTSALPPLHQTSIAVQVVIGLQMLIGEQEAVYSPTYSRPGFGASAASRNGTGMGAQSATAASSAGTGTGTGHIGANSYVSNTSSTATKIEMQTLALSHASTRPGTAGSAISLGTGDGRRQRNGTVSTFQTLPYIVGKEQDYDSATDDAAVPPQVPPKGPQPRPILQHGRWPSAATLSETRVHSDDEVAIEMAESRAHIGILSPSAFSPSCPSSVEGVGSGISFHAHSRHRSSKYIARPHD